MESIGIDFWQLWAAVAVICLIVELFTVSFFIICFSVGAIAALVASFFCGIYAQLVVFVLFSALSIFQVRPFAKKYLHQKQNQYRTNADALIGNTGVVSQEIKAGGYGRVAIGGDDWKAQADESEDIAVGTRVKVVGRESIIIKVTKL